MSQSLKSRPQSAVEPRQKLIALCDRIVAIWNDDLTSQESAQKLQRILNALDDVSIPSGMMQRVLAMRTAIVAWDREEDSLESIVDQAIDLLESIPVEKPLQPDQWAPDPTIVVELTDDRISIIKGGHIAGKYVGNASYKARFDRYSDAKLPAYPVCRFMPSASGYIARYQEAGRYLAKA